ncbi:hypothetical protein JMUB5695_04028 [Mycobacterium heckeshornense]|nr:hypothetical protein JMUB5695_04028 [Mycobacterium heckeshornense]
MKTPERSGPRRRRSCRHRLAAPGSHSSPSASSPTARGALAAAAVEKCGQRQRPPSAVCRVCCPVGFSTPRWPAPRANKGISFFRLRLSAPSAAMLAGHSAAQSSATSRSAQPVEIRTVCPQRAGRTPLITPARRAMRYSVAASTQSSTFHTLVSMTITSGRDDSPPKRRPSAPCPVGRVRRSGDAGRQVRAAHDSPCRASSGSRPGAGPPVGRRRCRWLVRARVISHVIASLEPALTPARWLV